MFYESLWILGALGFWKPRANVLLLGPENSGKTTFVNSLNQDMTIEPLKYQDRHHCKLDSKNFVMNVFEMSDVIGVRRKFPDSYLNHNIEGFIFLIDIADSESFNVAKSELENLCAISEWKNKPILILGNKADRHQAVTEQLLRDSLPLQLLSSRPSKLQICSILRRVGYSSGFAWLAEELYIQKTKTYHHWILPLQLLVLVTCLLLALLLIKIVQDSIWEREGEE